MKTSARPFFPRVAVAIFCTLTLAALAQEKPAPPAEPTAPAAPAIPAASAPATPPVAAPTEETPPATAPAEAQKPGELRRLDETSAPADAPRDRDPKAPRRGKAPRLHVTRSGGHEVVSIAHDSFLAKGQHADAVISVFGSSTSEGEVDDAVVSILGNTRVTGPIGGDAVAVLGNTYVNSKVNGEVVAVLGDVELGPDADVGGQVVSVGGTITRDPKAITHGDVQSVAVGRAGFSHFDGLSIWFRECLMLGRPLALARGLGFAWTFALVMLAIYLMLALVFRSGVDKCLSTLETRPGFSILTAILSILLTPVAMVLLCITIIGIAAVPVLALGLVVVALVGKTVMLAWVGRRILKPSAEGVGSHTVFAVLLGGLIVLALYCVPIIGLLVQKTFDVLGFGAVVFTLILANKREKPTPPPRVPLTPSMGPTPPGAPFMPAPMSVPTPNVSAPVSMMTPPTAPVAMPLTSPGFGATASGMSEPSASGAAASHVVPPAAPETFLPPPLTPPPVSGSAASVISAATCPRAGFMIRLAALLLDVILLGFVGAFLHLHGPLLLPWLAVYGAVMWKLKGTTIGGVVCGLKIVRIDDREIDWATAIVRALGCFLSLAVVGLGFLWVAIDDDKQSWHDKIAGTTVVRVPKGTSLI